MNTSLENTQDINNTINAVRDFMDENGYVYEFDAENNRMRFGFHLKCRLHSVKFSVIFSEFGYLVYATSPINGDPENLGELLKFTAMANYGMRIGNFEVDVRDGEIRFKCWTSTLGLDSIPPELIDLSMRIPNSMMERYGDGIAALSLGFSDAETEIAKCEVPGFGDDEGEDGDDDDGDSDGDDEEENEEEDDDEL